MGLLGKSLAPRRRALVAAAVALIASYEYVIATSKRSKATRQHVLLEYKDTVASAAKTFFDQLTRRNRQKTDQRVGAES